MVLASDGKFEQLPLLDRASRQRLPGLPIFRKEWLERGGPPAHGALMCERDDGACVYVELPLM
jgi:hypothetical protein